MIILSKLEEAIEGLAKEKDSILEELQIACWKDDRPHTRLPASTSSTWLDITFGENVPERSHLPSNLKGRYQKWYSAIKAIVAKNQSDRLNELDKHYYDGIKQKIDSNYISRYEQFELMDHINAQFEILSAVPSFLRYSMYDIELTAYSILMDDEISASKHLISNGFLRSAGALAGVILERHLKNMLRKHLPPIKYALNATLSTVNELCKKYDIYDLETWRKVQYLTDLRNLCDHQKDREPTKDEVTELIDSVSALLKKIMPERESGPSL